MKKVCLWGLAVLVALSLFVGLVGCDKREYVEVYDVREGSWIYNDKVTFFWGDNADGLTLEEYAFGCKKVKVLKKVASQTFPYESGEMLLNTELLTSDVIEDAELRQFAEQTKEKMSLKETEREKNAVFNQECIKKLGLTGRFILTGDLGRIVSQRANEYMTTEDYLAAIEASKSPLVKSLTYKRTDFEELDPELFPELPELYETTAVVSSAFFSQTMNSDDNDISIEDYYDNFGRYVIAAGPSFTKNSFNFLFYTKPKLPAEQDFLRQLQKMYNDPDKEADWLYKELEEFFGFEGYFYHFGTYSEHFISYEMTYFYGYDMLDLTLKKAEEVEDSDLIWGYFIEPNVSLSRYINIEIMQNDSATYFTAHSARGKYYIYTSNIYEQK